MAPDRRQLRSCQSGWHDCLGPSGSPAPRPISLRTLHELNWKKEPDAPGLGIETWGTRFLSQSRSEPSTNIPPVSMLRRHGVRLLLRFSMIGSHAREYLAPMM